jgi:hypothetical protein
MDLFRHVGWSHMKGAEKSSVKSKKKKSQPRGFTALGHAD